LKEKHYLLAQDCQSKSLKPLIFAQKLFAQSNNLDTQLPDLALLLSFKFYRFLQPQIWLVALSSEVALVCPRV